MTVNIRGLTRIKSQTLMGTSLASPVINWDFIQAQSLTSFSRGSLATMFDSTGKLTYAPNNLLLQSNTLDTSWVASYLTPSSGGGIGPDGSNSMWTLNEGTSPNIEHQLYQTLSLKAGTYIVSVYMSAGTMRYVNFGVSISGSNAYATVDTTTFTASTGTFGSAFTAGSPVVSLVRDGLYRCSFPLTLSSDATAYPQIAGAGSATPGMLAPIYNGNSKTAIVGFLQLEAVTYQTTPSTYVATTSAPYHGPRYPYAYNGATWDAQGLLAEQAATNLSIQSGDFNNVAWATYNTAKTNDGTVAPDGVGIFEKFMMNAGLQAHLIYNTSAYTTTANAIYTISVYVKYVNQRYISLIWQGNSANNWAAAVFDIGTTTNVAATQTAVGSTSGTIFSTKSEYIGNNIFRLSLTASVNHTSTYHIVGLAGAATGNTFDINGYIQLNPAGTETFYLWGAQTELGTSSTSYIPTITTSVTRNADTSLAFSAITQPTGLTFSRGSNAMQYDAAGRLTYAPNNLLKYSQAFSNSTWALGGVSPTKGTTTTQLPDGTTGTVDTLTYPTVTGGNFSFAYQVVDAPYLNTNFVFSVWVRVGSGSGTIYLNVEDNSVSPSPGNFVSSSAQYLTTTWQRIYLTGARTSGSGNASIQIGFDTRAAAGQTNGGSLTVQVWGAQFELVTYETVARPYNATTSSAYYGSRYDYDPVTRLPKGLLVEEGRTNLLPYSDAFNSWTTTNYTPTTNADTSPAGTQTADKLTLNNGQSFVSVNSSLITLTSGWTYTTSVYFKPAGWTSVTLRIEGDNNKRVEFLLTGAGSKTTTGSSVASASIESVGNGWYRCIMTTVSATTGSAQVSIFAGTWGQTGNGTDGILAWGAQLEIGAFATSYIPTTTASVSRSAEISSLSGTALSTVKGSAVSIFGEVNGIKTSVNPMFVADGTKGIMYPWGTSSPWLASTYNGSNLLNGTSISALTATNRIGASWDWSGRTVLANGNVPSSDTYTMSVGANVYLGTDGAGSGFINGWYRKFAAYNVRMADAKLKEKSVVGASF